MQPGVGWQHIYSEPIGNRRICKEGTEEATVGQLRAIAGAMGKRRRGRKPKLVRKAWKAPIESDGKGTAKKTTSK